MKASIDQPPAADPDSSGPLDGRDWMLRFQSGDDSAFDRIVELYEDAVRHFLYRFLSDRNRADDLTQEVFLRVFRSRSRYQPTAGLKTWLFTIANRLALNEIRGLRRRRRVFAEVNEDPDEGAAPWEQSSDHREESPEDRVQRRELECLIDELIDELPTNQRSALMLSRAGELSYSEIGDVLGVSVMAVKSLLMRARETMRRRLRRYLDPEGESRDE
ncbi:MAG: RNA polymerase sigma factor [Planctomycetota bacterium]